jgi:nucleoside-diphosphate-sugar epimerase
MPSRTGVQAHFGERFFQRVLAGKSGECMGPPSIPHAFTYGPDIVRALATLGREERAVGRVWHLPTLPARPVTEWADALGRELDITVRVSEVPGWRSRSARPTPGPARGTAER